MIFNEEKAKEIIERYSLSSKTLCVWKTRGCIPDKYAKEGYKKPDYISAKEERILWRRVADILSMKEINKDTMIRLANINQSHLYDALSKKSRVTKDELFNLIKEIKRLRLDIVKFTQKFTEKGFLELISDKRLKVYVIANDKYLGKRLINGRIGLVTLDKSDFISVRDKYIKLAMQLSIY